ncbi:MAG: hypothetical protein HQL35_05710 [Alphaproteobacteria bacterium]|nr:hypothetical protein [Alphaproteobacteria bacterium]
MAFLHKVTDGGTINPETGLPEFFDFSGMFSGLGESFSNFGTSLSNNFSSIGDTPQFPKLGLDGIGRASSAAAGGWEGIGNILGNVAKDFVGQKIGEKIGEPFGSMIGNTIGGAVGNGIGNAFSGAGQQDVSNMLGSSTTDMPGSLGTGSALAEIKAPKMPSFSSMPEDGGSSYKLLTPGKPKNTASKSLGNLMGGPEPQKPQARPQPSVADQALKQLQSLPKPKPAPQVNSTMQNAMQQLAAQKRIPVSPASPTSHLPAAGDKHQLGPRSRFGRVVKAKEGQNGGGVDDVAYRYERPLDFPVLDGTTVGPLQHEGFEYDNKDTSGYYNDGTVGPDKAGTKVMEQRKKVGPYLEDDVLKQAEKNLKWEWDKTVNPNAKNYCIGLNDCQDYVDAVEKEYYRLLKERSKKQPRDGQPGI